MKSNKKITERLLEESARFAGKAQTTVASVIAHSRPGQKAVVDPTIDKSQMGVLLGEISVKSLTDLLYIVHIIEWVVYIIGAGLAIACYFFTPPLFSGLVIFFMFLINLVLIRFSRNMTCLLAIVSFISNNKTVLLSRGLEEYYGAIKDDPLLNKEAANILYKRGLKRIFHGLDEHDEVTFEEEK